MARGFLAWPSGAVLGALVWCGGEPRVGDVGRQSHVDSVSAASALQADTDLAAACRRVWGLRADGSDIEDRPTGFPTPPAQARRCTARVSTRAVYYVWAVPNAKILAYWEDALRRSGYRTQRVGGRAPGRDFLRFAGRAAGKVSLSPRGGGFVIVFGGAV
jgi:hypothetical protein